MQTGRIVCFINLIYYIMAFAVLNIVLGLIVLSPVFISQEKRSGYQKKLSWLSIILLIWGIMGLFSSLSYSSTFQIAPLYWILWLGGGIIGLLNGLLLLHNLLNRKNPEKQVKYIVIQSFTAIISILIGIIQFFVEAPVYG
jgi:hypothetical protein